MFLQRQFWVGVMLSTQPFFVPGIEDPDQAKANAFGALGMFIFTFGLSAFGIWYDAQNKVETTEIETEYQLSPGDMPTYGTSS